MKLDYKDIKYLYQSYINSAKLCLHNLDCLSLKSGHSLLYYAASVPLESTFWAHKLVALSKHLAIIKQPGETRF